MSTEPTTVTAADGTALRLWERTPASAEEAVLHVHGSITSSRALFDPPVDRGGDPDSGDRVDDSYSWLAATARAGRAAFALDIRGYGDSDRPPEMDAPPEANDPPVRAPTAARDVAAAVDQLSSRFDRIHLVGVSWGTMVCGRYVADGEAPVDSLVQCAPVYLPPWSFAEVAAALNVDPDLDAYYEQRYDAVSDRQGGDDALFEAIWRTQVESNQGVDDETYLAQSGALADSKAAAEGERVYDATTLDVPTLVVRGSDDGISVREDALGLYDELDCEREYAEVGGADHYAMHGPRRTALYDLTNGFYERA